MDEASQSGSEHEDCVDVTDYEARVGENADQAAKITRLNGEVKFWTAQADYLWSRVEWNCGEVDRLTAKNAAQATEIARLKEQNGYLASRLEFGSNARDRLAAPNAVVHGHRSIPDRREVMGADQPSTARPICPGVHVELKNPKIIRREWDRRIIVCPVCGQEVPWTDLFGIFGHAAS